LEKPLIIDNLDFFINHPRCFTKNVTEKSPCLILNGWKKAAREPCRKAARPRRLSWAVLPVYARILTTAAYIVLFTFGIAGAPDARLNIP
jgi:hypothetical protein